MTYRFYDYEELLKFLLDRLFITYTSDPSETELVINNLDDKLSLYDSYSIDTNSNELWCYTGNRYYKYDLDKLFPTNFSPSFINDGTTLSLRQVLSINRKLGGNIM